MAGGHARRSPVAVVLRDLIRAMLASIGGGRERTRQVTNAMSSSPVSAVGVVDDVVSGLDRRRLAYEVRTMASAERMAERGWDWDSKVPDALFFGQTNSVGPAEARERVVAAEGGLARAADLFGDAVEWSSDLA